MPDLKGLKPGDPIMVPHGWRGEDHVESVVSKVGRRWVYVGGTDSWARRFEVSDGHEEGGRGRAFTMTDYAERDAREVTFAELRLRGFRLDGYGRATERLSLDQLQRIVAILKEE